MAPSLVLVRKSSKIPFAFLAMGAITGGMFIQYRGESRSPVNVYLPGCPPKQEAVIYAITKIRKRYINQKKV